jgi:hypothetical protein
MEGGYPKVIRIDSRFRASGSSTDFRYQLPTSVNFPQGTVCYASAVSLPHSWYNVEEGVSDRLYVIETRTVSSVAQRRCRVLTIPSGNYTSLTLPTAVATALNAGTSLTGCSYAVDYVASRGILRIQLSGTDGTARFRLPSEDELTSASWRSAEWTGTADAYNITDPDTMGDLLRLPGTSTATTLLETGLLDVSPIHVLYLHSNLASFDTWGPRGEQDIIQMVPVTSSYGYVLSYVANGATDEFFPVSRGTFLELRFSLTNSRGRVIDLHGGQMSIELTFADRNSLTK